jgi:hypothetical protein
VSQTIEAEEDSFVIVSFKKWETREELMISNFKDHRREYTNRWV